jgi:hypothetical protein
MPTGFERRARWASPAPPDGFPSGAVRFAKVVSAAEPRESAAYIKLNIPTPCPPRSAVPVNAGAWFRGFVSARHARFRLRSELRREHTSSSVKRCDRLGHVAGISGRGTPGVNGRGEPLINSRGVEPVEPGRARLMLGRLKVPSEIRRRRSAPNPQPARVRSIFEKSSSTMNCPPPAGSRASTPR